MFRGRRCCTLTFSRAARRLLKSLSIKQGIKYDDPESANDIPAFIAFHKLNVDEILDPLDSFSTCCPYRLAETLGANLHGRIIQ